MKDLYAVVLAGGKGTRMGGDTPKVLMNLAGKPIIYWCLNMLKKVGTKNIVVVVGYKSESVKKVIKQFGFDVKFVKQTRQLGTANSLGVALKFIPKDIKNIFALFGDDSALYSSVTIEKFIRQHLSSKSKISIITIRKKIVQDIGGLKIDKKGNPIGVLFPSEIKQYRLKMIDILCGAFCFDADWLRKNLLLVRKNPRSGEYPLPSIIEILFEKGDFAKAYKINDDEWNSINNHEELQEANKKKLRQLKLKK